MCTRHLLSQIYPCEVPWHDTKFYRIEKYEKHNMRRKWRTLYRKTKIMECSWRILVMVFGRINKLYKQVIYTLFKIKH